VRVTVRLLGSFRSLLAELDAGPDGISLAVAEGATVAELLAGLPVPAGSAHTALVNGRHAECNQVLRDEDELSVFPAVGGG